MKLTLVCVPLGGMLGGLLAARVLPTLGWRGLYAIGGALPLFFAVVLLWALPESTRFLRAGRQKYALKYRTPTQMRHDNPVWKRAACGTTIKSVIYVLGGTRWALSGFCSGVLGAKLTEQTYLPSGMKKPGRPAR